MFLRVNAENIWREQGTIWCNLLRSSGEIFCGVCSFVRGFDTASAGRGPRRKVAEGVLPLDLRFTTVRGKTGLSRYVLTAAARDDSCRDLGSQRL